MNQQLAPTTLPEKSWWSSLLRRLNWAITAFRAPGNQPVIVLNNGIALDLNRGLIIIEGDMTIHSTGNLRLSADKHLVLQSGQDVEPARPDYLHSVWINPEYDDQGRPIQIDDDILIEEQEHGSDQA